MSRNNVILAAVGGAAIAAVLVNFLGTEKGKQLLSTASDSLKQMTDKATDFAKNKATDFANSKLGNLKNSTREVQPS